MEKDKEYGVPWLWKRLPVGTWMKSGCGWMEADFGLIKVGELGSFISITTFPFINGKLFDASIPISHFDSKMRDLLIEACEFDWSKVSPVIFGSLFQTVMNEEERHSSGGHYTARKNIMKVIQLVV